MNSSQQHNQITLGLLFVATLVITLFGRLPLQAAPSAPERPRALLAATSPCASFSDRNIGFDFLGYLPLADGATMLAWRITNPKPKALDAIGVSAFGWQRVKPSAGGTFQGDLGVYDVKWGENLETNGSAFRFLPRGTWLRAGRQESFFVTVKQFDPVQSLRVWVRINDTVFEANARPADYPCLVESPIATATATATETAMALPSDTPIATATATESATATALPSDTPIATATATESATATALPTETATALATATETEVASPSATATPTDPFVSPLPTPTATATTVDPLPTPTAPATTVDPLPTSIAPALPASVPNVAVYIVTEKDFSTQLTLAEKQARWDQGQPAPEIAVAAAKQAAVTRYKPDLLAPVPNSLAQSSTPSWTMLYRENFDNGFPAAGQQGECQLELFSNPTTSDYLWGADNFRTHDNSTGAAWPYRGGGLGPNLHPGTDTYPDSTTTQLICTFSNLSQAKNVLADFALWLDRADDGDQFFVGFHAGELNSQNQRLFRGLTWGSTNNADGNAEWKQIRLYYPEVGQQASQNGGSVAVMWQFTSDGNRRPAAQGAWLDSIQIERYLQPATSVGCENLATSDTTKIHVPGAPGAGQVSKGLNLPPDSDDNTWQTGLDPALIMRLTEAATNWVRLEFEVQPSAFLRLRDATALPETIDLKHYDELIDNLCANNIAVLGLLTYQSVADQSWQAADGNGQISDSYLNTFTRTTSILVDYYNDRVKAWEVWNEPDYSHTGLAPDQFARLLISTSSIIHAANDLVVFGGLANVDRLSESYFREFYEALNNLGGPPTPYDIFALHPYPSYEYIGRNNQLLLDPQAHWRAETPTVLAKFQNILLGDNALGRNDSNKEIWVTEFGWNSASGSQADLEDRCVTLEAQWVTVPQQIFYVGAGLDVLFKETAWPGENRPAVTKAFLYQYQDTSSPFPSSECTAAPAKYSPSWWSSWFWQLLYGPPPEQSVDVPWSFGLYDGNLQPKSTRCTFKYYPDWIDGCYTFDYVAHLPIVNSGQAVTAAGE